MARAMAGRADLRRSMSGLGLIIGLSFLRMFFAMSHSNISRFRTAHDRLLTVPCSEYFYDRRSTLPPTLPRDDCHRRR